MSIEANKVVRIEFTLKDDKGSVLASSEGSEALEYLHGVGDVVPGLERALAGKGEGDAVEVTLAPADAYGERDEKLVRKVPVRRLSGKSILVGGRYPMRTEGGGGQMVQVLALSGDYATVDPNHVFAGMTVTFQVKVVGVRDATADEIAHRHAHGAGGAHEH